MTSYTLNSGTLTVISEPSFDLFVSRLYAILLAPGISFDYRSVKVKVTFIGVTTVEYSIEITSDGLNLVNQKCRVVLEQIFPHVAIFNKLLREKTGPVVGQPAIVVGQQQLAFVQPPVPKPVPAPVPVTSQPSRLPQPKKPESKEHTLRISPIKIVSDKLKVFEQDKIAFFKMKADIENSKLTIDNMYPEFVAKYCVFEIMVSRKQLNEKSNTNIKAELDHFSALYDKLQTSEEKTHVEVHVPHNYFYFNTDQKRKYAKKYNMTLEDFEEKHVRIQEPVPAPVSSVSSSIADFGDKKESVKIPSVTDLDEIDDDDASDGDSDDETEDDEESEESAESDQDPEPTSKPHDDTFKLMLEYGSTEKKSN